MIGGYKRPIVVAALMVSSLVFSALATPHEKLADTRQQFTLETAVPKQFGDWRLDESLVPLPPSPDQASVLNQIYDQILSRTYINGRGERIMLSITYGSRQTQQLRAHRQEVCYRSQGFNINGLEHVEIPVAGAPLPATRMVATQNSRVEPVTYWFTTGDTVVLSYWDREWAQFKYALSGYVPDGYLVRISSLQPNAQLAYRQHIAFADALFAHVDPELRRRLVGHL
jgi:EpsI family protein